MNTLLIRHKIKVPVHNIVGTPALMFDRWLPSNKEDYVSLQPDSFELSIYPDIESIPSYFRDAGISNSRTICCEYIIVDIKVKNIRNELLNYLKTNSQDIDEASEIGKEATLLGKNVYSLCINSTNRLLNYFRYEKGQYWLDVIEFDTKNIYKFNSNSNVLARNMIDKENDWFPWCRRNAAYLNINLVDPKTSVNESDWNSAIEFLASKKRINFSLELLSKSRTLAQYGYSRNAIVDAYTALEHSLNLFSQSADTSRLNSLTDSSSLGPTINHLGVSVSVKYFLPLILPENVKNTINWGIIIRFIELRNNIVHRSQKEFKEQPLAMINDVEKLIKLLIDYTKK